MSDFTILKNIPCLLLPQIPKKTSKVKCLIAAPLPVDLTNGCKGYQYWLCDMILLPRQKYQKTDMDGWKFSDILTRGDWANPKHWQALKDK